MAEPFIFANGQVAYNSEDLIKLCQQFPDDSVNYLLREDFEKWLSYIGAKNIAQFATEARQASIANEQKLSSFIAKSQDKSTSAVTQKSSPAVDKPKDSLLLTLVNFFRKS
jgi:hypothetical protein